MGNNVTYGFQNLPSVYLRDLRKKTGRRFRFALTTRKSEAGAAKKTDADAQKATELNSKSVAEYVISNPDFLDELVMTHIAQDRVRAWIKVPTDDDQCAIEAADYEGNVQSTAQEFKAAPSTTDDDQRLVLMKFSKKDLHKTDSEKLEKEEEIEDEVKEEDEATKEDTEKHVEIEDEKDSKDKDEKEESTEPPEKPDEKKEATEPAESSEADKSTEEPKSSEKEEKVDSGRSRGDSNFQQQIEELSFRQRKTLIITRGRLVYPITYQLQELKALLERPDLSKPCREINR
ncbi:uncharacterized protein CDAR_533111 [Caerostris darwini]|uniref:Uncharacterized protein n=1 Tax=Caerostris darwini TaxID=1538125 RepID=A0AAV4QS54_9ARAC|nr:uncharacterized protein CDAR_533111 [Caerostris darwini]